MEWVDLASTGTSEREALATFFKERGLGRYEEKLIEVSDAESVSDLKLLDGKMMEEVISLANLKFCSKQKFRAAIAEIQQELEGACREEDAEPLAEFFSKKGLGRYQEKLIEVTDAEAVADLKLLDGRMVEEVISLAELKLLSAQKFREAMAELRKEALPEASDSSAPQECIAICIDRSASMKGPFSTDRTRMEAVKQMFYAFRDRTESARSGHHKLGLLQFDDKVEKLLDLTSSLDSFEAIVDDMETGGMTAIYSAIIEGVEMLTPVFQSSPSSDLRVLVLTDGKSNTGSYPQPALEAVNRIGATVDAIIVGDCPDGYLRKIVTATGGECYQISNIGEGFELLEAESVVSLKARRNGAPKPVFKERATVDLRVVEQKTLTKSSAVQRVLAVDTQYTTKKVANVSAFRDDNISLGGRTAANTKRLLKELKQVAEKKDTIWMHSGEGVHIFPAPDCLSYWRALIEGPVGSPFEGGVFVLNVVIPDNYPGSPPQITFDTPIYHCNVSESGQICLKILQDGWNPTLTVPKALEAIRIMMKEPDTNWALRQWIAELTLAYQNSGGQDKRYFEEARRCTSLEASRSIDSWTQQWSS